MSEKEPNTPEQEQKSPETKPPKAQKDTKDPEEKEKTAAAPAEKTPKKRHKKALLAVLVTADLALIAGLSFGVYHYRSAVVLAGQELSKTRSSLQSANESIEKTNSALSKQQDLTDTLQDELSTVQDQLSSTEDQLTAAQAKADNYDSLYEAFDGLPKANSDFFASANVLTLKKGKSKKVYVYLETDESKSYETVMEPSNDCITASWDSDDFDENGVNSVTVKGAKEGVSVLGFINGYNEETGHVVVMVTE